jgi:predicted ester cyclase
VSTEESKALAMRFHACDLGDYGNLLSEDFQGHDGMGHTWGRGFQIAGLVADLQSFSGFHDVIHDVVAEEGKVALRFTRSGRFVAKFENFEPTQQECSFEGLEILHVRDGKIVEAWDYNDDETVARTLRGEE